MLTRKLLSYCRLIRLDKPIGIFLLLWPTLWALWIASKGRPSFKLLFVFVLGTILMRSAGCAINDFADYQFDGQVARTRKRPLVTGEVTRREAFALFTFFSLIAFLLVLWIAKPLILLLAFAALAVTMIYPFMKRITHLPQLALSIAFALGIPMAFAAQLNTIPALAWLLFLATALWIVVYDTFYAMTDRQDDLKAGVKSTAVLWGQQDRWVTGILQMIVWLLWLLVSVKLQFHWFDYWGLLLTAGLFIYQQVLIRNRDPALCFKAFLNNHWVGLFIFLGLLSHYSFHLLNN